MQNANIDKSITIQNLKYKQQYQLFLKQVANSYSKHFQQTYLIPLVKIFQKFCKFKLNSQILFLFNQIKIKHIAQYQKQNQFIQWVGINHNNKSKCQNILNSKRPNHKNQNNVSQVSIKQYQRIINERLKDFKTTINFLNQKDVFHPIIYTLLHKLQSKILKPIKQHQNQKQNQQNFQIFEKNFSQRKKYKIQSFNNTFKSKLNSKILFSQRVEFSKPSQDSQKISFSRLKTQKKQTKSIKSKNLNLRYQNRQFQNEKKRIRYNKQRLRRLKNINSQNKKSIQKKNKIKSKQERQKGIVGNSCLRKQSFMQQRTNIGSTKKYTKYKKAVGFQQSSQNQIISSQSSIQKRANNKEKCFYAHDKIKACKNIKQVLSNLSIKAVQSENETQKILLNKNLKKFQDQQNINSQDKKNWMTKVDQNNKINIMKSHRDKKNRRCGAIDLDEQTLLKNIKLRMIQSYWKQNHQKQSSSFSSSVSSQKSSQKEIIIKNNKKVYKSNKNASFGKKRPVNNDFYQSDQIGQFLNLGTAKSIQINDSKKNSSLKRNESLYLQQSLQGQTFFKKKNINNKYQRPLNINRNHKKMLTSVEQNRIQFSQIFSFRQNYVNFLTQKPVQLYRISNIDKNNFNNQSGFQFLKQFKIDFERKEEINNQLSKQHQNTRKSEFQKESKLIKMSHQFRKYMNNNLQQKRMKTQIIEIQNIF